MLRFANGGILIEDECELPQLPKRIEVLFGDFETSSNDPKIKSINPWMRANCSVIGMAITWDDCPDVYFIPRHLLMTGWLESAFTVAETWCNHNIKYDVHVAYNDLGLEFVGELKCTLALAKIFDSDRMFRGGYGLDVLVKEWLSIDIHPWELALQPYLGKKNKDYGRIPIDLLADYGCEDVVSTRLLYKFLMEQMPEESRWVANNETRLTRVLVATERRGMQIRINEVKLELLKCIKGMMDIEAKLEQLLGYKISPNTYNDVYDLLINRFGFPKIKKDGGKGEASFDKRILIKYEQLGPPFDQYREIVKLIRQYRSHVTHKGLFWEAWLSLCDEDGVLHSDYNQNVRTGRTSCKQPNSQQLDLLAKRQIVARPGYKLLCYDYNQQEYRWMMHYLDHQPAIQAYLRDPDTDYHQWVADNLCEGQVKRKPAKTLNFAIGFGAGKLKTLAMLTIEPDVVALCEGDPRKIKAFALKVYEGYHRNLPSLKRHQRMAASAVRVRGYARTCYGRRLRIPPLFDYKGFNNVVQCTAADTTKEAMVEVSEVYNEKLHDLDCHLLAVVHDEFLFEVPDDPAIIEACDKEIQRCLTIPGARCKVPIVADRGPIAEDWGTAKP